ncbi:hypothetical protein DPMN_152636 [Dreissena polymorpha]|uniref:Uncharacterized protein n=1 Tax=Dreissena polymorpha TaxID=45954 RepID=A0A9D4FIN5_DREPO|nr:hypothetical protein DPMN_152636 [Dreissena polymorpha]
MDFERNERQLCKKTRQWGSRPIGWMLCLLGSPCSFRRGQWTRHDRPNGLDLTDST